VIYFNAPDLTQPYGYNPLRHVSENRIALAASGMMEVFKKMWPDAWGVRMEHILRNVLIAQGNMNAAFDFARELSQAKSPSAFLELSAAHARKQLENLTTQTQHLTGLAQKSITEATQSLQTGVAKTFNQPSSKS
jgi:hypothetical protein